MDILFSRLSVVLMIMLCNDCLAGEKVNQSLSVTSKGIVFVEIPRGVISIEGWDKPEIIITGELDDTIKQLTFKTKPEKTLIKADTEGKQHWGDASTLKIMMPKHSQLHFKGIDTSFNISKLSHIIQGKTITGDVIVSQVQGKVLLSVVSGNVELVDSSGLAKVQSVSGEVEFSGNFEQAFLKSMSGDITADISGTNQLTLKSVSGDTLVSGQIKDKAQLKLSSVNGDIVYLSAKELNAQCQMVSQFGGEINNQLTDDMPQESSLHKKTLSFVSGDGSGELIMNTVTGSITIKKMDNE